MELIKSVGLASDHAGYELKQVVKQYLDAHGIEYKDFGCFSPKSCDYPDYAHPLANAIEAGEVKAGIALCGSGEGMSMTLNKHQGIRAALCWRTEIAEITRKHNNSNIIVIPARFIDKETTLKMLDIFFNTDFEGGRHLRRINKMPLHE